MTTVLDLDVIEEPAVAMAALDPLRARILRALAEPGSATTVAGQLHEPRQKINYHLRELERHGLVELVEERPRRGLVERVVVASAKSYVVSPGVLGDNAGQPERTDRWSSRYLIALAGRVVAEMASLTKGAERVGQPLASLAIDANIRFASPGDRAAFTDELSALVASLVARYHDENADGGRRHRLVIGAYPQPVQEDN